MSSSSPPKFPVPTGPPAERSEADRDELVRSMIPLVHHIVNRMGLFLPPHIAQDDLISAGVIGLIDAVERYDAARGSSLKTFCSFRIRGEVLDELRRLDWVPRSVHREARVLEAAQEALAQRLGREPTEEEVCVHLGLTSQQFTELLDRIRPATYLSLQEPVYEGEGGDSLAREDVLPDETAVSPFASLLNDEDKLILRKTMGKLPAQQLQVLSLYYMENLRLKEIAEILGITESRVSQVHTLAITRLRAVFLRERKR